MPDLSDFKDFQIESLPVQQRSSVNLSIINNRRTEQRIFETVFTYRLTPLRSGNLLIPPPKVAVGGMSLEANVVKVAGESYRAPNHVPRGGIDMRVIPPDSQDNVILSIETNKDRFYPLQPITVSLVVRIKKISELEPLSIRVAPPDLSIPWIEDKSLPKGIVPKQNANEWLAAHLLQRRTRGFSINGYARGVFSFSFSSDFEQRQVYEFLPSAKVVQMQDQTGAEQSYWEYRFDRIFTPQDLGRFTFGPATLKGSFVVADSNSSDGITTKRYYALAKQIEIAVVDVPQENRPPGYIGAFGTFDWSADVQPRKAKVGDPLTLTLELSGIGSTSNVTPPDIASLPEATNLFKVSPVNDKGDTFIYTIRPTTEGEIVFPAILMSYFDVEKEQFVSLASTPIPIEVAAAQTLKIPLPRAHARGSLASSYEVHAEGGLFANMTNLRGAVDQSVPFLLWMRMLVFLFVGYGLAIVIVRYYRHKKSDPARARQQSAFGKAKRGLAKLKSCNSQAEKCNVMQGILTGYVADLTNSIQEGMTVKDVCVKLEQYGKAASYVNEVREILETLDGAKYGGADDTSLDALPQRIEALINAA